MEVFQRGTLNRGGLGYLGGWMSAMDHMVSWHGDAMMEGDVM